MGSSNSCPSATTLVTDLWMLCVQVLESYVVTSLDGYMSYPTGKRKCVRRACRLDKRKIFIFQSFAFSPLHTTIDIEILSTCMHIDVTGHRKVAMTPLLSRQLKLDLGDSCSRIEALRTRACAWTLTKMNTVRWKKTGSEYAQLKMVWQRYMLISFWRTSLR